MKINPLTAIDFYKTDHRRQYPEGITEVYANFTPRGSHRARVLADYDNKVVFFGLQYFLQHFLCDAWQQQFFAKPKAQVVRAYQRRLDNALGKGAVQVDHIAALHDLGYLPLKIKALPEGTRVPFGVPLLTIVNTHPDFFWLPNYIESVLSCYLWKPITSATTAFEYKRLLQQFAKKTGTPLTLVDFQVHDFSMRGMTSLQDSAITGAAHLTEFLGTDSVAGIDLVEDYYQADVTQTAIGLSVPATEHSVMCMGTQAGELGTFRRLINELYPQGVVSIVADTWDFWHAITDYLVILKDEIMARDGKVVIRPDSGDPLAIICGDPKAAANTPEYKGAIECLWDIFGGTITDKGYKMLDCHIGLIYGDSITLDRAQAIVECLAAKGFASGNVVFGVGSYTYQHVTRDTFGFAMKATSGVVNGIRRDIFKDPKTDAGTKRSAKGLLRVEQAGDSLVLYDQQSEQQEQQGLLRDVFCDGKLLTTTSLGEIRQCLSTALTT